MLEDEFREGFVERLVDSHQVFVDYDEAFEVFRPIQRAYMETAQKLFEWSAANTNADASTEEMRSIITEAAERVGVDPQEDSMFSGMLEMLVIFDQHTESDNAENN